MTEKPRYDFHMHTFFSDGELLPIELIRRASVLGNRAIAITDHASYSNLDDLVPAIARDCDAAEGWGITAIPRSRDHPRPAEENGCDNQEGT